MIVNKPGVSGANQKGQMTSDGRDKESEHIPNNTTTPTKDLLEGRSIVFDGKDGSPLFLGTIGTTLAEGLNIKETKFRNVEIIQQKKS